MHKYNLYYFWEKARIRKPVFGKIKEKRTGIEKYLSFFKKQYFIILRINLSMTYLDTWRTLE